MDKNTVIHETRRNGIFVKIYEKIYKEEWEKRRGTPQGYHVTSLMAKYRLRNDHGVETNFSPYASWIRFTVVDPDKALITKLQYND